MVANSIQNLPAFVDSGQHSIVTAPADTGPSPRMRNLTLRGSGSTSLLPAPVVALSCRGFSTLIIAFPFMSYFWIYRPTLGNCVSSAGRSSPRLGPGSGSLLHAGAAFWSAHRVGPSVSRCAGATKIVRPLESTVATQPQLHPALLRLSAMISQYFFTAAIYLMRRAVRLWLVFPVPADVRGTSESHDHPAAVFACRRFAQVPRSQAARSSRVRLP